MNNVEQTRTGDLELTLAELRERRRFCKWLVSHTYTIIITSTPVNRQERREGPFGTWRVWDIWETDDIRIERNLHDGSSAVFESDVMVYAEQPPVFRLGPWVKALRAWAIATVPETGEEEKAKLCLRIKELEAKLREVGL